MVPTDDRPVEDRPAYVVIGRITRPHGVRGEVRVVPETDFPERFDALRHVFLVSGGAASTRPGDDLVRSHQTPRAVAVESVRRHGDAVLLKLSGIDGIEDARALRDVEVAVPWEERVPLPDGTYYVAEIVGLAVRRASGEEIGRVIEVIRAPGNDVYRVETPDGQTMMLPAVGDVVRSVDLRARVMVVDPP